MSGRSSQVLHVAVGVIENAKGEVLISRRDETKPQGGLWEFPGGKVEFGENAFLALCRELQEELSIKVEQASPLIQVSHRYADLAVFLDVWTVDVFSGSARSCEGQAIKWLATEKLASYPFPQANGPIIKAAMLPHRYAILGGGSVAVLLDRLQALLNQGLKLVQLRQKQLTALELRQFLSQALPLCHRQKAHLLVNSAIPGAWDVASVSLHLTGPDLKSLKKRPPGLNYLAASCHNLNELKQAQVVGVDFAVLSPVKPTLSHPEVLPLGWQRFAGMLKQVNMPVFALGGLCLDDEMTARRMGAQGIAGIGMFSR